MLFTRFRKGAIDRQKNFFITEECFVSAFLSSVDNCRNAWCSIAEKIKIKHLLNRQHFKIVKDSLRFSEFEFTSRLYLILYLTL